MTIVMTITESMAGQTRITPMATVVTWKVAAFVMVASKEPVPGRTSWYRHKYDQCHRKPTQDSAIFTELVWAFHRYSVSPRSVREQVE